MNEMFDRQRKDVGDASKRDMKFFIEAVSCVLLNLKFSTAF